MSESGPQFRIIGNIPEEKKEEAKERLRGLLFERHLSNLSPEARQEMERLEYLKNPEELTLIDLANKKTSGFMEQTEVQPYEVPSNNFHIVPEEIYTRAGGGGDSDATTFVPQQAIFFNAKYFRGNPVYFGKVAFHELMHLKAHYTQEMQTGPNRKISVTPYREGIGVRALQKKGAKGQYYEYFRGVHEAVAALREKDYVQDMLQLPEFEEERAWLESPEAKQLKEKISKEKDIPEEEIIWIARDGGDYETIAYPKFRRVLHFVTQEIQQQFPEQYPSQQAVENEFLKAHFSGRLLPISHLVDQTFGNGSFRTLGIMKDSQTALQVQEILRKNRLRQKQSNTPETH